MNIIKFIICCFSLVVLMNSCGLDTQIKSFEIEPALTKVKEIPILKSCAHPDADLNHPIVKEFPSIGVCIFHACNISDDPAYRFHEKYNDFINQLPEEAKKLSQIFSDPSKCQGPPPPMKQCQADSALTPISCDGTDKTKCPIGSCLFEICPLHKSPSNKNYQAMLEYLRQDPLSKIQDDTKKCSSGCKQEFAISFDLNLDQEDGSCRFNLCNNSLYGEFDEQEKKLAEIKKYNQQYHQGKLPIAEKEFGEIFQGTYKGNIENKCSGKQYGCTNPIWIQDGSLDSQFTNFVLNFTPDVIDGKNGLCEFKTGCVDANYEGYRNNQKFHDDLKNVLLQYKKKFPTFNQNINSEKICGKKIACFNQLASNPVEKGDENSLKEKYVDLDKSCTFQGCLTEGTEQFNKNLSSEILRYFNVSSINDLTEKQKKQVTQTSCGKSYACMNSDAIDPKETDKSKFLENGKCKFTLCCDSKYELFAKQKDLRKSISEYNKNIAKDLSQNITGGCGEEFNQVSTSNIIKSCTGATYGCTTPLYLGKELPQEFPNFISNFSSTGNVVDGEGGKCLFKAGCIDETKANYYKNEEFNKNLKNSYKKYQSIFNQYNSNIVSSECGTKSEGCTSTLAKNAKDPIHFEDVKKSCEFEACFQSDTEFYDRDKNIREATFSYFSNVLKTPITNINQIPVPLRNQIRELDCGRKLGCTSEFADQNIGKTIDQALLKDNGTCTFTFCVNTNYEKSLQNDNIKTMTAASEYNKFYHQNKAPIGSGKDSYGILFKGVYLNNLKLDCKGRLFGCTSEEYFDGTKSPLQKILGGSKDNFRKLVSNYVEGRVDEPASVEYLGRCLFKDSCIDPSYLEYDLEFATTFKQYLSLYPNHESKYSTSPTMASCKTKPTIIPLVPLGEVDAPEIVLLADDSSSYANNADLIKNTFARLGPILEKYGVLNLKIYAMSDVNKFYNGYPQSLVEPICPEKFSEKIFSMPNPRAQLKIDSSLSAEVINSKILNALDNIQINAQFTEENGLCFVARFYEDYKIRENKENVFFVLVSDEDDSSVFSYNYNQGLNIQQQQKDLKNPVLSPICFKKVSAPLESVITAQVPAYNYEVTYSILNIRFNGQYTVAAKADQLQFAFMETYNIEAKRTYYNSETALDKNKIFIDFLKKKMPNGIPNNSSVSANCSELKNLGIDAYLSLMNPNYLKGEEPCKLTLYTGSPNTTTTTTIGTSLPIDIKSPNFKDIKEAYDLSSSSYTGCTDELIEIVAAMFPPNNNGQIKFVDNCQMNKTSTNTILTIGKKDQGNLCEEICGDNHFLTLSDNKQYDCFKDFINRGITSNSNWINDLSVLGCKAIPTTLNTYDTKPAQCLSQNSYNIPATTLKDTSTLFNEDLVMTGGNRFSSKNWSFLWVVPMNTSQTGSQYCDKSSSEGKRYIALHDYLSKNGAVSKILDICSPSVEEAMGEMLENRVLALLKGSRYELSRANPKPQVVLPIYLEKLDQQGNVIDSYSVPEENMALEYISGILYVQFKPTTFVKDVLPKYNRLRINGIK